MAHEVQTMAYRKEEIPWHGLGSPLSPNQPLEVWSKEAGFDWEIKEAPVLFNVAEDSGLHLKAHSEARVLYRSDSQMALSVVGSRYQVVQPSEVLEFYRDLVSVGGFELETAGVLKGGKKLWALAKTGQEATLRGNDRIKAYLLLATSCDGTLATTCQWTSIRVCCSNTLQMAVGDSKGAVKIPHSTQFDAEAVKKELGIGISTWQTFMSEIKAMSERKVNRFEAASYLVSVLGDSTVPLADQPNSKAIQNVLALFSGQGKGSELQAANGTVWGLLNGVTEYVDQHRRARSQDYRLDSAWFGQGAAIKEKAFTEAMKLAA